MDLSGHSFVTPVFVAIPGPMKPELDVFFAARGVALEPTDMLAMDPPAPVFLAQSRSRVMVAPLRRRRDALLRLVLVGVLVAALFVVSVFVWPSGFGQGATSVALSYVGLSAASVWRDWRGMRLVQREIIMRLEG